MDGFVINYTIKPNEQRPNLLLAEEPNPLFSTLGCNQRDENNYISALLAQIDVKLNPCPTILSTSSLSFSDGSLMLFPNPTGGLRYLINK
jgi:hypothetical protein